MLRTTPAGWRIVIDSVPGLSVGIVSPWICVTRPAASRKSCAVRKALKPGPQLRRTDFGHHRLDELRSTALHDVGGLQHHCPPGTGARGRPRRERLGRRLHRVESILDARCRTLGDELARQRAEALERPAAFGVPAQVVNDQLGLHLSLSVTVGDDFMASRTQARQAGRTNARRALAVEGPLPSAPVAEGGEPALPAHLRQDHSARTPRRPTPAQRLGQGTHRHPTALDTAKALAQMSPTGSCGGSSAAAGGRCH